MAEIQKFLDKQGTSTLWSQVVAKINAIPQYDDTQVKADIAANTESIAQANAKIQTNADAIAVLKGTKTTEGSVAYQIAQIVAGADESFDTLKEIADWISSHGESASAMQTSIASNAEDIEVLQTLVGSTAVATQISQAIAAQDLDKYALAENLTTLSNELSILKKTGSRLITTDEISKLSKLVMEQDGSVSISGTVAAGNVQGLSTVIDERITTQVTALSTEEIKAVCV